MWTFVSSSIGAVQEVEITVMLPFHRTAAAAISSNQDYEGLGQRIEGGRKGHQTRGSNRRQVMSDKPERVES